MRVLGLPRLLALLLVLGLSCSKSDSPLTQILVVVDTDLAVPMQVDAIQILVPGSSRMAAGSLTGSDAVALPVTLALLHNGGPLGPFEVDAVGSLAGAEVARREARVSFLPGRTVVLRLDLLGSCLGMTCGDGQTCGDGGCRNLDVGPSELVDYVPGQDLGRFTPCPDGSRPDRLRDPMNCGACDHACAAVHAQAVCDMGTCDMGTCDDGYFDCDDNPATGCEAQLATNTNCGGCGVLCELPFAMASCDTGTCQQSACDEGHASCDGLQSTGCETALGTAARCAGCDPCPTPAGASATCAAMTCGILCDGGFLDCDGDTANGCEAPASDPGSCGTCGNACSTPTPFCAASSTAPGGFGCVFGCTPPLVQCGMSCIDTNADPLNCGRCTNACAAPVGASATCAAGVCGFACDVGLADCDADPANGCEVDITSDPLHCGGCGSACALANVATHSCAMGACGVTACATGFADCDATPANGCEIDLSTTANCGACGVTCAGSEICLSGMCQSTSALQIVQVTAGRSHSCARRQNGETLCWGLNDVGQLGTGTTSPANSATPVAVTGVTTAVDISAGDDFTCAALGSGEVRCWGNNQDFQLGDATDVDSATPVVVMGVSGAVQVAAGGKHACALTAAHDIWCWGTNDQGQVGNGTSTGGGVYTAATRITATGLAGVAAQVSAGNKHTCAVNMAGELYCWGNNSKGQLGDGTTTQRHSPVLAVLRRRTGMGMSFTAEQAAWVSAGKDASCAASTAGHAFCWGDNQDGQGGIGSTTPRELRSPSVVLASRGLDVPLANVQETSVGGSFACARLTGGALRCWGKNQEGELGDGSRTDSPFAVVVSTVADGLQIDCGKRHSCVVRSAGGASSVACWGDNQDRQLGDGVSGGVSWRNTPVDLVSLP